jgi:hypothetical protein
MQRILFVIVLCALMVSMQRTPARAERPEAACPSCWPIYIIEGVEYDTNGYQDIATEFDDCENAHHVHDYTWTSIAYECPKCTATWIVFEHAPACPVCGWHRTNPVMEYDPCV